MVRTQTLRLDFLYVEIGRFLSQGKMYNEFIIHYIYTLNDLS